MISSKQYTIHAGWENDALIGTLYVVNQRGTDILSFEYDISWLEKHPILFLDPELYSTLGRQYCTESTFHFLADASPDRWGRMLIKKELTGLYTGNLSETDYLLHLSDAGRAGGIRIFDGQQFIMQGEKIPPFTAIQKLQDTSWKIEDKSPIEDDSTLKLLFDAGSSLGGARPKANVIDEDGNMWIAKLQSKNDYSSTEQWEKVTHDLAELCELNVPEAQLLSFSGKHVFLIKRFDRDKVKRIHFASAMTFVNGIDGTNDFGFLDIANEISMHCTLVEKDCQELWKRMAFSLLVSNTDCHLRNHGFLLHSDGWHLSPMYDVNPNPSKKTMALKIDDTSNEKDIQLAINVAPYFNIQFPKQEIERMQCVIHDHFHELATNAEITRQEERAMASCFGISPVVSSNNLKR